MISSAFQHKRTGGVPGGFLPGVRDRLGRVPAEPPEATLHFSEKDPADVDTVNGPWMTQLLIELHAPENLSV